jgi:hypothetical protein
MADVSAHVEEAAIQLMAMMVPLQALMEEELPVVEGL